MNLGVIVRADERGLAHQTWEVVRALQPAKVLAVRVASSERRGHRFDESRFPDAAVFTIDETTPEWKLPEGPVRAWLEGLDVVYTAETFYDDRIATWARQQGVATVIHANPEWYRHHRGGIPHPTVWWSATDWRHQHLPDGTRVVPMPVPDRPWPAVPDTRAVYHPAGVVAAKDRNGTDIVIYAASLLPDVEFYLSAQEGLRGLGTLPNLHTIEPAANYWEAHAVAPVMVLPRRYGGLCLPTIEACGAGVVPVMPDCIPNSTWPAVLAPASRGGTLRCQGGEVKLYDVDPHDLAATIRDTFDNLDAHRQAVSEWAEANSWDNLASLWRDELARAVEQYAPPAPPLATVRHTRQNPAVSILIPYTESRSDLCEWVAARWKHRHPDWEVVVALLEGEWCKARAVQAAADAASGDVFVIADCDSYTSPEAMHEAVQMAQAGRWAVPHAAVYRLDGNATKHALRDGPTVDVDHVNAGLVKRPYEATPGGGITVLPRAMWDDCPLDDRFVGYGFEDYAWGDALSTLHGRPHLCGGDLVHLWHEPLDGRRKPAESIDLKARYRAALGSPRMMRALVDRVDPPEAIVLEVPAVFTHANPRIRLKTPHGRVLFRGGRFETTNADLADALRMIPEVMEVV